MAENLEGFGPVTSRHHFGHHVVQEVVCKRHFLISTIFKLRCEQGQVRAQKRTNSSKVSNPFWLTSAFAKCLSSIASHVSPAQCEQILLRIS